MKSAGNTLKLKRVYIDTQIEHVVYMLRDCAVYKAEGFESLSRVKVELNGKTLIASLNIINDGILKNGQAGLSESAWNILGARDGDHAHFSHPPAVVSMEHVRAKMYGQKLGDHEFREILQDIINGSYSNVEISAFITACAAENMDLDEITSLTKAMVDSGQTLSWQKNMVVDKHCVGGLPGNRTTPIVVSIIAEAGLTIPKTSSRAITSPAGTADTMETLTKVDLDLDEIKSVVKKENGCFAWGGSVKLSPADDIMIRVERALDIDSDGQMIASVLSKKKAAGSSHIIIDMPLGKTAKVRSSEKAEKLKYYFNVVATALGLKVKVIVTDGSQPVGYGIGPSLEAMDILKVLKNDLHCAKDLRERSLLIAGELLELAEYCGQGLGNQIATEILNSGRAYKKFMAICEAQGAVKEPRYAKHMIEILAKHTGIVVEIDNRKLSRAAKLAGAPREPSAGILLLKKIGDAITTGEALFRIYSEATGELEYALEYLHSQNEIFKIE